MNDNKTHIYRIRRKLDGAFLCSLQKGSPNPAGCSWNWGPTGVFFKKPETIRKHLVELCQIRKYDLKHDQGCVIWNTPVIHLGADYSLVNLYEVVSTEITVHGEHVMEASDFASFLVEPIDKPKAR